MIAALLATLACAPKPAPPAPQTAPEPEAIPRPGPLPDYTPPAPLVEELEDGASLWVVEDHRLPLASVRVVLPGGADDDPPGLWGMAAMAADMMDEGAGELDALALAGQVQLLGADLEVEANREGIVAGIDVASERLDRAVSLLADVVMRPRFEQDDWERVQRQRIQQVRQDRQDPRSLARETAALALFGPEHPHGHPVEGTPAGIEALDREQVAAWQHEVAVPVGSTIIFTGDVSPATARGLVEDAFAGWSGRRSLPEVPPPAEPGATRIVLTDLPGAAQTAIRAYAPGYPAGSPDEPAAELAGTVLGGSFTSRLNHLLREEKGYTYGAFATFAAGRDLGVFLAATSVRADATAPALHDMLGVLAAAPGGCSDQELAMARSQLLADAMDAAETRAGMADTLASRAMDRRDPAGWAGELHATLAAGEPQVSEVAGRYVVPQRLVVALVGDAATVQPALAEAGYQVERIEPLP